jgi:hypothetical protein
MKDSGGSVGFPSSYCSGISPKDFGNTCLEESEVELFSSEMIAGAQALLFTNQTKKASFQDFPTGPLNRSRFLQLEVNDFVDIFRFVRLLAFGHRFTSGIK